MSVSGHAAYISLDGAPPEVSGHVAYISSGMLNDDGGGPEELDDGGPEDSVWRGDKDEPPPDNVLPPDTVLNGEPPDDFRNGVGSDVSGHEAYVSSDEPSLHTGNVPLTLSSFDASERLQGCTCTLFALPGFPIENGRGLRSSELELTFLIGGLSIFCAI